METGYDTEERTVSDEEAKMLETSIERFGRILDRELTGEEYKVLANNAKYKADGYRTGERK